MNERIQQMIYSLNEKVGVHWTNEDKIKFAELIVQECVNTLEFHGFDDAVPYIKWMATNKLGVKA